MSDAITTDNIKAVTAVAARVSQLAPELATRMIRSIGIIAGQGVTPFQKCSDVYAVCSQSGEEPYQIATDPEDKHLICTCADHTMREQLLCKHVLAVLLMKAIKELEVGALPSIITTVKYRNGEERAQANPYAVTF